MHLRKKGFAFICHNIASQDLIYRTLAGLRGSLGKIFSCTNLTLLKNWFFKKKYSCFLAELGGKFVFTLAFLSLKTD
jgi:hypothetical protein